MSPQAIWLRLLARDHAARCRVLGHPRRPTTGVPCVLASLGARTPEAWQHHPGRH